MKPLDWRLVRRSGAARGFLITVVGLGIAATALVMAQASILARLLAAGARGDAAARALAGTLGLLLLIVVARAVTAFGGEAAALRAATLVKSQLRRALAAHVLRLGPAWLGRQRAGEITAVATGGLDALDGYFARYLPQLVLAVLVPVAVVIRVGAADLLSGAVIALTAPLIPVFAVLVNLHTKAQTQRQWNLLARLAGHFLDVVEGLPTLKAFRRSRPQERVIAEVTQEHRIATMRTLRTAFLSSFVLELSATISTAIVAVEVGLRLLGGHLSYQTALLVLLLTPEAYIPLRAVGLHFHASAEGAAAAGRALDILDTPVPRAPDGDHGTCPDLKKTLIYLENVSLRYPGRSEPVLSGVDLEIRPGERVVITGASGAGKSSLLALLLRLAEPTSGKISAGGTGLAAIAPARWREQTAWVPQSPYLFAGTIAENIALGRPAAARAEIERAAGLAGASGLIASLPDGLDTALGERGDDLSSGQRQRIALARAFLRDAPLLLLDEPAAHLDPAAARELAGVLSTLMAGRTVIEVTHDLDLDLAATADRILLLQSGQLRPAPALAPDLASTR